MPQPPANPLPSAAEARVARVELRLECQPEEVLWSHGRPWTALVHVRLNGEIGYVAAAYDLISRSWQGFTSLDDVRGDAGRLVARLRAIDEDAYATAIDLLHAVSRAALAAQPPTSWVVVPENDPDDLDMAFETDGAKYFVLAENAERAAEELNADLGNGAGARFIVREFRPG